jgi:hypothetical protein
MKTFIKFPRFEKRFGRDICYATLLDEADNTLFQGSLAQIFNFVDQNELEVVNSQEILKLLVGLGFAS